MVSNFIYIIKLVGQSENVDTFRRRLCASEKNESVCAKYYLVQGSSANDNTLYENMLPEEWHHCAILDYKEEKIEKLYWVVCKKVSQGSSKYILCKMKFQTTDRFMLKNFTYNLQLNLKQDFAENSYINKELSSVLIKQMKKHEQSPYAHPVRTVAYSAIEREQLLHPLAQKNEYCKRQYNLKDPQERSEYQRDYDRILYSKSFRRMVDKAQIFSAVKGDHFRTRMTHTLAVCQIAKSICQELNLNINLAEAIAVGHDLGHTPFGHQGERTLHAILTGEEGFWVPHLALVSDRSDIERAQLFPYGGFKHNYQSVRVATNLESQYLEFDGLDLSEQTLNGMWMHTKTKEGMRISDFSSGFLEESGQTCAFTLEGQIVALADEIAQRSHDIDDAFASRLIDVEEFIHYLELNKLTSLKTIVDGIKKDFVEMQEKNRLFPNENQIFYAQISAKIVRYFIVDVVSSTKEMMEAMINNTLEMAAFHSHNHKLTQRKACFSHNGMILCEYLDKIIRRRVISSREVTLFDQNGSNVVLALFRTYYNNPMLLFQGTLRRIEREFLLKGFKTIDFYEGDPDLVREEWNAIVNSDIPINDRTTHETGYLQKRIILIRAICDFIAGMTDTYALSEYRKTKN